MIPDGARKEGERNLDSAGLNAIYSSFSLPPTLNMFAGRSPRETDPARLSRSRRRERVG